MYATYADLRCGLAFFATASLPSIGISISLLPRAASCVDNPRAVHRFKSQPDGKCSCNPQIAIELQRSAGHVAPFRVAKIDFDVITDIAAKRKIDSKSRGWE
jgi:hypothetical protein